MTVRTFNLDPDGFKDIKRKLLAWTIPLGLIACLAGMYISSANKNTNTLLVDILPILIPLITVAGGSGLFMAIKMLRKMWETYELKIDGETISRTQENTPTITIDKSALDKIIEYPEGHILLKTRKRNDSISIPRSIKCRDQLLAALAEFGQINYKRDRSKSLIIFFAVLVSVGLMLVFYTSKERGIVIPTGLVLTTGIVWSFLEMQRSKQLDRKTKLLAYAFLPLLFSIIGRILAGS